LRIAPEVVQLFLRTPKTRHGGRETCPSPRASPEPAESSPQAPTGASGEATPAPIESGIRPGSTPSHASTRHGPHAPRSGSVTSRHCHTLLSVHESLTRPRQGPPLKPFYTSRGKHRAIHPKPPAQPSACRALPPELEQGPKPGPRPSPHLPVQSGAVSPRTGHISHRADQRPPSRWLG